MTVLCLVEHESGEVIDASAAALTFARTIAQPRTSASAGLPGTPAGAAAGETRAPGDSLASGDFLASGGSAAPGEPVVAVLFCATDELPSGTPGDGPRAGVIQALAAYGVSGVYLVESDRLVPYAPLAWARVLAELIEASSACAVLAAGTDRGNEVLAHLGAITGKPMVAGCVSAVRTTAPGAWQIVRQRWAGSLLEDAVLDVSPALLTVAYDAVAAVTAPAPGPAQVKVHTPAISDEDLRVRVIESARPRAGVSLATARVVVGGGRGVGGPEGFGALEELAGLLGGAVGVSRVVTSQGWRPHTQQVGQTGTRIAPELYLACGISGAIQHMAGCLGAKHIVVINTDPDAPIIGHADYAVIGDLKEVIPALVAAIRARAAGA